jgi:hypothetical protein
MQLTTKRHREARPDGLSAGLLRGCGLYALVLLAVQVAGCSLDLSRLRAPSRSDAGVDVSVSSDAFVSDDGFPVDLAIATDGGQGTIDAIQPNDSPVPVDGAGTTVASDGALDSVGIDQARADVPEPDGLPEVGMVFDAVGAGGTDGEADVPASGGAGGSDDGGFGGAGGSGGAAGSDAFDTGGAGGGSGLDAGEDAGAGGAPADASDAGTGGVGLEQDLVLWYKFDESSGTVAADSSPVGTHPGTLVTYGYGGGAAFSTDAQVGTHALKLTTPSYGYSSAGGYVTVPAPESLAPDALTIAVWVKLSSAGSSQSWARIFDFGNGSTVPAYFYLTARATDVTNNPVRFGISKSGHTATDEQRLETPTALSANVWHHIAVVLPAGESYTGTLYLDGVPVASNSAMSIHLSDLGATTLNWLGRSPFTSDPFLSGGLDDFRIYKRALSAQDIAALYGL